MTPPRSFQDNLNTLPTVDAIAAIELLDSNGQRVCLGWKISRYGRFGAGLPCVAATSRRHQSGRRPEGLALYAEHTADARQFPGKHPNIDRLLAIAEQQAATLQGSIIARQD
ncbi:DUF2322 family protein [Paludibacterium denitrificans]|uniref:DUF2322 family protein n=1 Tax=Paludibacterium denitrificans TaxID=2675226 RepID=UPI001E41A6D0|nr:DUF2322 family protein [Paludibacterium denitrificans]